MQPSKKTGYSPLALASSIPSETTGNLAYSELSTVLAVHSIVALVAETLAFSGLEVSLFPVEAPKVKLLTMN